MGYIIGVVLLLVFGCIVALMRCIRRRAEKNAMAIEELVSKKFQEEVGLSKASHKGHSEYPTHLFPSSYGYESNEPGNFYPSSGGNRRI